MVFLELFRESVTDPTKYMYVCVLVCSTVFRLVTPNIKLDSSTVWLDPTQCRLDTAGERVDCSSTVVTTSLWPWLCAIADAYSDGTARWNGLRRPATQPAAAGQVQRRLAEGDSWFDWGCQWLACDKALKSKWRTAVHRRPSFHLHLTALL